MRAPPRKGKSPDHFFKFIAPGSMSQVSIPDAFRKYLKNENTAILRRGCWKWLVKISDNWVFEEGWESFVRENGVEDFDFVVLKHEGKMVFDIMVFDPTWCEREYPTNQVSRTAVEKACPEAKSLQKSKIRIKEVSKVPMEKAAHEYPHFKFTATACSIKKCYVNVPWGFAKSNGFDKRKCEMIVVDEKQRLWSTKLSSYKNNQVYITGIRDMLVANRVKKGDEFLLELIENGDKPLMNIHYHRTKPSETHGMVEIKGMNRLDYFNPPNHFFKFIPPGRMSQVSIPESFTKYLKNKTTAILRRGCRKWLVKITDNWVFEEGWESFVSENGVEDFDIVVFKHEGKMVFDIMVFDHTWCERGYPTIQVTRMEVEKACPKAKSLQKSKIRIKDHQNKPTETRGGMVETKGLPKVTPKERAAYKYPSFKFIATTNSIKKCFVNVPFGFVRSNGLDKGIWDMVVVDEKQRVWPTKLRIYIGSHAHITGIRDMIVANGLKEGDELLLELVDNGDKLLMNLHCMNGR